MILRVTTWNVNGLRAAIRKGLDRWVDDIDPDVLLLNEIRCTPDQLDGYAPPGGRHAIWHPAEKPGWSGVAAWHRVGAEEVGRGLGRGRDRDGRVLQVAAGELRIVSVYLPSGSAGPERQAQKERFMHRFLPFAAKHARSKAPVLVCGDLNIAPDDDDVANPTTAKKVSGFLPHERAWFARLLATGWTDVVRRHFGRRKGPYTWWSNFGRAKVEDRGWRLDHVLANRAAAVNVRSASVHREAGIACSDHAPVTIEIDVDARLKVR